MPSKRPCPRLGFEDVTSILLRFTTVAACRRDDLLQRYTVRLIEHNKINRTICSKSGCITAQGNDRFLDVTTCELRNRQSV
jgi:hypothetical protein